MDGMFIAYHNTDRIFGFQYVPLEEMDERLYGRSAAGPLVFDKCMQILEATMLEIIHHFPEQVNRILVKSMVKVLMLADRTSNASSRPYPLPRSYSCGRRPLTGRVTKTRSPS